MPDHEQRLEMHKDAIRVSQVHPSEIGETELGLRKMSSPWESWRVPDPIFELGPLSAVLLAGHLRVAAKQRRALRGAASALLTLFFIVSGCCKSFDPSTKQENETARVWLTKGLTGAYDWKEIERWRSVAESRMPQAWALLQTNSAVQVTSDEAHDLTGEFIFDETKGKTYLLRAVGDASGTFPVEPSFRLNGEIWIGGGANSKCPVPMRRRPIVAQLEKAPANVYVTFFVNRD
jgi:hypothetical protein